MRAVSLFSGIGALDLAVAEVFGAEPVAFAEMDPNASKVLAARWPGVPNVGDVTAARWEDWEGVDVLHGGPPCQPTSSAGKRLGENDERWMWPAALDALRRVRPRWVVWENPSALLGLGGGVPFGRILGEMASLGYVGSYGCLRASDVGACHQRDRLWIVAADADRRGRDEGGLGSVGRAMEERRDATRVSPAVADAGQDVPPDAERVEPERRGGLGELAGAPGAGEGGDGERQRVRDAAGRGGAAAADADRPGPQGRRAVRGGGGERAAGPGGVAAVADAHVGADDGERAREELGSGNEGTPADANGTAGGRVGPASRRSPVQGAEVDGRPAVESRRRGGGGEDGGAVDWGDYAPAIARHARLAGRPAPAPVDERGRLSARFVEWMMCLPAGWVTGVIPANRRIGTQTSDWPGLSRNPALKALGNCVVPPCAVAAMRQLRTRLETGVAA